MLSYQHGYHAGSFADVLKHFTLTQILHYLNQKEKPYLYLETHAGRGIYNLDHPQAQQTKEYLSGIKLLWDHREHCPAIFSYYLSAIAAMNPGTSLVHYPGSPAIMRQFLRAQDRAICCELHTQEFQFLKQLPKNGKKIHFCHQDGLEQMLALLPPKERRAMIFIDPSYEVKTEYRRIPQVVKTAYQHFPTGVYCVWYPIIDQHWHQLLIRGFKSISEKYLQVEFYLNTTEKRMTSCGLWIINPPYLLKREVEMAVAYLKTLFHEGHSSYFIAGDS